MVYIETVDVVLDVLATQRHIDTTSAFSFNITSCTLAERRGSIYEEWGGEARRGKAACDLP